MGNRHSIDETNCAVHIAVTLKSGSTIFGWARAKLTGSEPDEDALEAHPLSEDPMYWFIKDLMSRVFPLVQREEAKRRILEILENLTVSERAIVIADLIAENQLITAGQSFNSETISVTLYWNEKLDSVKGGFLLSQFAGVHCCDPQ